jgi:hypothetical protein
MRLKQTILNKTSDWTTSQLLKVLQGLKKNKSRDPNRLPNELFDPKVAGNDLIAAVCALMNRIKRDGVYPHCLHMGDITSIYKGTGPRNEFGAHRGIFRVQVLRNILERLIYNDEYEGIDSNLTDCNVGARKNRNIRDNIFVLNAVMNDTINGSKEEVDIAIYDVDKCFDSLWLEECINDVYEAGLQNDKLNLLYLMNENAMVAIKTPYGTTDRINMKKIVMKGTVWGSLLCTATMDKLGKQKYSSEELLFKYKGEVGVPALEMVDDVVDVQKCGKDAVKANALVNSFIEHKKLTLSSSKCHKIHCGKKNNFCPKLKVHMDDMHEAVEEKYLGDQVNKNAKHASTISKRRAKGFGIISDIIQIINIIPDMKKRIRMGLLLRQAWFVNAMLVNMEAWHNVLQKDTDVFVTLDHYLVRKIVCAHSKVPSEMLYLETSAIPINFILASRRINFLHNILSRPSRELTKRIFEAQRRSPVKGDWYHLVQSDLNMVGLNPTDGEICSKSKSQFKNIVKLSIKSAAFSALKKLQSSHTKIRNIRYSKFEIQPYLQSSQLSEEEISMLFNMRADTVNGFKSCFSSLYRNNPGCKLSCKEEDSIRHSFSCLKINISPTYHQVQYEDIFSEVQQQKAAVQKFITINTIRSALLASDPAYQGLVLDTAPPAPAGEAGLPAGI